MGVAVDTHILNSEGFWLDRRLEALGSIPCHVPKCLDQILPAIDISGWVLLNGNTGAFGDEDKVLRYNYLLRPIIIYTKLILLTAKP